MKKSTMAVQKCKNILLRAALKDFWSSANPKLEELKVCQNSLFQDDTEENARIGGSMEILLFSSDLNIASQWVFKEKLNFEGLQTNERHESHLMMS